MTREIDVPLDVASAFALFTERMTDFWPREHSIGSVPLAEVVVEPGVGGRWFERGVDGSECNWGRVAVWEAPVRLILHWQINAHWQFDPTFVTEVEVQFIEQSGPRCRVILEHRGLERYGDDAERMHSILGDPNGWQGTLIAFATRASSRSAH